MKFVRITTEAGEVVADKVSVAESFLERLLGLMFRDGLGGTGGMLLRSCRSIHTCFMRFDIDVVFLTSDGFVVHVIRRMKPWRFSALYWRASETLELEGGRLSSAVRSGVKLEVRDV